MQERGATISKSQRPLPLAELERAQTEPQTAARGRRGLGAGNSSGTGKSLAPSSSSESRTNDANSITALRRKLSSSDFNTAMVHFYRGEIQRSNTWRNRLDTTTNWAVLTAGATLSFAFSSPQNPHFVIIINSILIAYFLVMEARRYRYYELWSSRVRVIETSYLAQMLKFDKVTNDEWADALSEDLLTPHFTISEWEAIGRRLRRNYLWIFVLLASSWNLKVYMHPVPAHDFDEFLTRAAVGVVPGGIIFAIGVVFNTALLIFAIATVRLREATGEVLPHHEFSFMRVRDWTRAAAEKRRASVIRRSLRARTRLRARSQSAASDAKTKEQTINTQQAELAPEETSV